MRKKKRNRTLKTPILKEKPILDEQQLIQNFNISNSNNFVNLNSNRITFKNQIDSKIVDEINRMNLLRHLQMSNNCYHNTQTPLGGINILYNSNRPIFNYPMPTNSKLQENCSKNPNFFETNNGIKFDFNYK